MYLKVLIRVVGWMFVALFPSMGYGDSGVMVVDPVSRLIWQKRESGRMRWREAKDYCGRFKPGGSGRWRLPNRKELQSLYIIRNRFPDGNSSTYWSSITHDKNKKYAWRMRFDKGKLFPGYKSNRYSVRCVRDMFVVDTLYRSAIVAMGEKKFETVRENLKQYFQLVTTSHPYFAAAKKLEARLKQVFRFTTNIKFVLIKGGCFQMGDTFGEGEDDEEPVHQVCVGKYLLSVHEVTVGQFREFTEATGYQTEAEGGDGCFVWNGERWTQQAGTNWKNPLFPQEENHPVTCVSWNDVQRFIQWMNGEGDGVYRLPTEAEWEYAARAGTTMARYWGNDPDEACAYANVVDQAAERKYGWIRVHNCDDGYVTTAPVGRFLPNNWGVHDMLGNVWEWVSDWYGKNHYKNSLRNDPKGPETGAYRVRRGGSWYFRPRSVRIANRDGDLPTFRSALLGFRLAKSP